MELYFKRGENKNRSQTAPLNSLPLLHFCPGGVHKELVEWLPEAKIRKCNGIKRKFKANTSNNYMCVNSIYYII